MIATHKKPATVNKKSANAALRSANWKTINWDYYRMIVRKLQLRIAKATQLRKYRKVKTRKRCPTAWSFGAHRLPGLSFDLILYKLSILAYCSIGDISLSWRVA